MKKIQLILLCVMICSSSILAQSTRKTRNLKPKNFQKKVTIISSEKSRTYYSISSEKSSILNITGPGTLRVITRGRFAPKESSMIKYDIIYTVNSGRQKSIKKSKVKRSKKATYLNGALGVPGQLRDFEIVLGRGDHTIGLKLAENSKAVEARYIFTRSKKKKRSWIRFSPDIPSEPVDLVSGESTVNYYRFSYEKPLKVNINGPAELRVLTRIENHYNMKGRIKYRIQVKEDGIVKNTYQLSSKHSEVATYKKNIELVPGKACEFVIEVPKGNHNYEISILDKNKSTVLGRLLIPKEDVGIKK